MKNKIIAIVFSLVGTVCLCSPVNSMLGADGAETMSNGDLIPFIRITPTTTSVHYSPFPTGVYFLPYDSLKLEMCMRIVPDSSIGTWGTIFGNTGHNDSRGFNLRQYQGTSSIGGYFPLISTSGQQVGNTSYGTVSEWSIVEFDSSLPANEMLLVNGVSVFTWDGFYFDYERLTVTSQLYIGEGPRGAGYGSTCSTDWRYVRIWLNGELVREYVPDSNKGFFDNVNNTYLDKDSRSNTRVEYLLEEVEPIEGEE